MLELAQEEAGRDNLLSSACLDFFEFLRVVRPLFARSRADSSQANVKAILNHLCDKYRDRLTKLGESETTFAQLVVRWEQNNAPAPTAPASASTTVSSPGHMCVRAECPRLTLLQQRWRSVVEGRRQGARCGRGVVLGLIGR